ncbi:MAG: hypothetical protein JWN03_4162 [Nocardia sp.]|nr:hypothetical protein [Nocardia sp.]
MVDRSAGAADAGDDDGDDDGDDGDGGPNGDDEADGGGDDEGGAGVGEGGVGGVVSGSALVAAVRGMPDWVGCGGTAGGRAEMSVMSGLSSGGDKPDENCTHDRSYC